MECPICMIDYDDTSCIPKVLPNCGHTICMSCINKLRKSGKIQCSDCRLNQKIKKGEDLPTNFAIFELIFMINNLKKENEYLKNAGVGMDLSHILDDPAQEERKESENHSILQEDYIPKFYKEDPVSEEKHEPADEFPSLEEHLRSAIDLEKEIKELGGSINTWACQTCTYINNVLNVECEICGSSNNRYEESETA
ncbi:unnamed protein product [Moneuplotes crassus]|uniref:RanBP-type and C3HC4-type zinc finger-containing protein 1 n=1 Tax=Euplotes crassus TaxID=5936 RepID=A0AAD1XUL5_EUPCR|nr:unnamed protein product [Moneuplotes crassus]